MIPAGSRLSPPPRKRCRRDEESSPASKRLRCESAADVINSCRKPFSNPISVSRICNLDPMIPAGSLSPPPRKRCRHDQDDDPQARASKRLRCESAADVIKAAAAASSERAAQLLLRFSDAVGRGAKHKMDDDSTRVSAAGGSSSKTRAHKREEQSPDQLQVEEEEEMPIKSRITAETRQRMGAWLGGLLGFLLVAPPPRTPERTRGDAHQVQDHRRNLSKDERLARGVLDRYNSIKNQF